MIRRLVSTALLGLALEASAQFDGVTQVGRMTHFGIAESSGIAVSRRYPGVIWTHNDGGFQFLFAVNRSGKFIGAFQVGGNLVDWEDIGIDNKGNIYLADTGTNGMFRTHLAVHRVREPNPYRRYGNAKINRTWLLRFPEGPTQDCESFFVHGGFGHLITKTPTNGTVSMYRFSLADRRKSIPLQLVTLIPVDTPITAAALSLDNRRLGLTSSQGVYLFFLNGGPASAASARRLFFDFENRFMEGGAFFGNHFLTSAETRQLWLFRHPAFQCRQPALLVQGLANTNVSAGERVRLEVHVDGCPLPRLTWRFNGQVIPGATEPILDLGNVSPADAGVYQVVVSNRFGTVTSSATLGVRTKPDIRITEVMSSQFPGATVPRADWFELINFEPQAVDLSGWRFNDSTGGLADPFVIQGIVIFPGETIIFVENLSAAQFRTWWGAANVPSNVRIFTYAGSQLSFSDQGDTLFLWDNLSEIVTTAEFGLADPGVTFIMHPFTGEFGIKSEVGVHGAIRASSSPGDVGSPGVITR